MLENAQFKVVPDENGTYVVRSNVSLKYVRLGKPELKFLEYLTAEPEKSKIDEQKVEKILGLTFEQQRYLYHRFEQLELLSTENKKIREKRHYGLSNIPIAEINPNKVLNSLRKVIGLFCSKTMCMVYFILVVSAAVQVVFNNVYVDIKITDKRDIILFLILVTATYFIHELSHAALCKFFGGDVNKMGLMLFYLLPVIYCDISDTYLISSKRKKIIIGLSGIISQIILSALAVDVYFLLRAMGLNKQILILYAFINVLVAVFNILPIVKLDGYWVLTYLTGIQNLRDKSFTYVYSKIFRKKSAFIKRYSRFQIRTMLLYGITSLIFTPLFWIYSLKIIYTYAYYILFENAFYLILALTILICFNFISSFLKVAKGQIGGEYVLGSKEFK